MLNMVYHHARSAQRGIITTVVNHYFYDFMSGNVSDDTVLRTGRILDGDP